MGRLTRNPLMRGGLIITAGILTGNILGFVRSAITAYLLGTRATADGLVVALGPIDTLNSVLINTMIFGFVPMLAAREGAQRVSLFRQTARLFTWIFSALSVVTFAAAPWLIRLFGPGLEPSVYHEAINVLRLTSLSTLAASIGALHAALLYTERRFGPFAFYQAVLNTGVILGALVLWRSFGVYGFAIGYTAGAFTQLAIVWAFAKRSWESLSPNEEPTVSHSNAELFVKPGSFLVYAGLLAINIIVTRAYATQAGSGMAAAFDYCIRCVNVVIAYLVSPVSNSLLPEIATLRTENRGRDAFRLITRSLGFAAIAALASCAIGIAVRQPVISVLFERGSFTGESTRLVSDVFLGFAPSLIGLSLLEITSRSLFALGRPWLPVMAACVPVSVNLVVSSLLHTRTPEFIGVGASAGLLAGFALLFVLLTMNRRRLIQSFDHISSTSK